MHNRSNAAAGSNHDDNDDKMRQLTRRADSEDKIESMTSLHRIKEDFISSSTPQTPLRNASNDEDEKMRAASPDSGIGPASSPLADLYDEAPKDLLTSSQDAASNADSCTPIESTPASPQEGGVDSLPYRLCLERPPEPPKPKPAEPSIPCQWEDCTQIFFEKHQLQDHLQNDHVQNATSSR